MLYVIVIINTLISIVFFSFYEPDRKWISLTDLFIVGVPNIIGIIALIILILKRKIIKKRKTKCTTTK